MIIDSAGDCKSKNPHNPDFQKPPKRVKSPSSYPDFPFPYLTHTPYDINDRCACHETDQNFVKRKGKRIADAAEKTHQAGIHGLRIPFCKSRYLSRQNLQHNCGQKQETPEAYGTYSYSSVFSVCPKHTSNAPAMMKKSDRLNTRRFSL